MIKFRWETEFKETEIGEIPRDWETGKLEEATSVDKLCSKSKSKEQHKIGFISMENIPTDSYIPSFEIRDLERVKSGKEVYPNSILLAKITPSFEHGKMCIVPNINDYRWFATTEVFSLVPKNGNITKFLFYLLKHPALRDILENSMSGPSERQRVQRSALKNLIIPLPSPEEQSRIATVLSWFDDLIENKKKQNEILEKTAMAIFKSWFVDFEPFKDNEFVDSDLGKIPKGWEVKRLDDLCKIIMGQSPPSKYYNEKGSGLLFIQGKGQMGKYTPNTNIYCSKILKLAKPKDILITVRAPVGELNIADGEYIIGRGIASLRSNNWVFIYLYLLTNNGFLKAQQRGTTFEAITKEELENFPVVIPPQSLLEKFNSLVEPLFQKIILNQKQIMVLKKVRDALLPLLVFGKLRVEEI